MFSRLAVFAVCVAIANAEAAKIVTEGSNLVLKPSADGTVMFEGKGGRTSVTTIVASIAEAVENGERAIADMKASVDQALVEASNDLEDGLATIEPALADAKATADAAIAALTSDVSASEQRLEKKIEDVSASITKVVEPKIQAVKDSLVTLETKIKNDIDNDIKGKLLAVQNAVVGANSALPADNCGAILKARPGSSDGKFWIKSKYQSAALNVMCKKVGSSFVSMGGDCTNKAQACASCEVNPFENSKADRWIDPDSNAEDTGNSKLSKCEDNLMIKLVTTDGHHANWDSSFWSSNSMMNDNNAGDSKWKNFRSDIKAKGYITPIGKTIEIKAMKGSTEIGRAFYNIKSAYQGKSLKWLMNSAGQNTVFATKNNGKSASGRPIYNKYMYKRGGNHGQQPYDMFLDTTGDLVARQRNYAGSQNSWSRLSSTDRSGWKGCHCYTGIGGDHYCNGWRIQYEASPIVGYCSTYNRYGSNHQNRKGGPEPNTHCGGTKRQSNIDFAILKNPK